MYNYLMFVLIISIPYIYYEINQFSNWKLSITLALAQDVDILREMHDFCVICQFSNLDFINSQQIKSR